MRTEAVNPARECGCFSHGMVRPAASVLSKDPLRMPGPAVVKITMP
jgi:hypothetical protein